MRRVFKIVSLSFFSAALLIATGAEYTAARTISSVEASRLTFAALTAPPRAVIRSARRHYAGYRHRLVVSASYKPKGLRKGAKARFVRPAAYRNKRSGAVPRRSTHRRG